jgi:hypothetical protein
MLPGSSVGRAAWLVSEMNVWRGQINAAVSQGLDKATAEDSIPDPHATSMSHAAVAAKIVLEARSLATYLGTCYAR